MSICNTREWGCGDVGEAGDNRATRQRSRRPASGDRSAGRRRRRVVPDLAKPSLIRLQPGTGRSRRCFGVSRLDASLHAGPVHLQCIDEFPSDAADPQRRGCRAQRHRSRQHHAASGRRLSRRLRRPRLSCAARRYLLHRLRAAVRFRNRRLPQHRADGAAGGDAGGLAATRRWRAGAGGGSTGDAAAGADDARRLCSRFRN